jgi:hypothetical protein
MLNKLDVDCYIIDDSVQFVANSYLSYELGSVTFELPPDIVLLNASPFDIGSIAIKAAERSSIYNKPSGYNFDDVAKVLGYKTYTNLKRKSKTIHISRRNGSNFFEICTLDKKKRMFDVSDEVQVPINDLEKIGDAILKFTKKLEDF